MPIAGALIEYFKNNPLVWLWCQSSESDGCEVVSVTAAVKGLNSTAAQDNERADAQGNRCDACQCCLSTSVVGVHGFGLVCVWGEMFAAGSTDQQQFA